MPRNLARLFAACAVSLGAGHALAQSAAPVASAPVYQGAAFVTAVSSGCAADQASVGDYYTILYRPTAQTGPSFGGGVALVTPSSSYSYVLPKGVSLNGGLQNFPQVSVHGESSQVGPVNYTGSLDLTISPSTLTAKTTSVFITGTVGDVFNFTGCNVTIRAALALRP